MNHVSFPCLNKRSDFVLPCLHAQQLLAPPKIKQPLCAVPSASLGFGWQFPYADAEKSFRGCLHSSCLLSTCLFLAVNYQSRGWNLSYFLHVFSSPIPAQGTIAPLSAMKLVSRPHPPIVPGNWNWLITSNLTMVSEGPQNAYFQIIHSWESIYSGLRGMS